MQKCEKPLAVFCIVIIVALLFMFIMTKSLKNPETSHLLTLRWSNSALIYTSADPGWCCKNAVDFSHPFQMYVTEKIFRVFTGRCNIYNFMFQKSRLLLRMLPRKSLNQFQSTQLKRSERTTGYGEQWLLENKNKELIWKWLNLTKRSFHMEVGKPWMHFLHWCKKFILHWAWFISILVQLSYWQGEREFIFQPWLKSTRLSIQCGND